MSKRMHPRPKHRWSAVILSAICLVPRLGLADELHTAGDEKRLRLAFITCAVDQAFFVPVKQGMRDAATMLNVDCDFLGTDGVDVPAQAAMINRAVADGYDGLAVNIIDPLAFDEPIAASLAAGVPVVAFNVDDFATPNPRLAAVSQKFYDAGKKVAERAARELPAGSQVLLVKHDDGVSALDERQRAQIDVLRERGFTWVTAITGNKAEAGAAVVAQALREHPDIRVVLGSGQADTEAAGRAIADHFAGQGYWAAGFDLSPKTVELIESGAIRFTVDQQPYAQGFYPVVQLTLWLRHGITPSDIDAGAAIIDQSNVAQVKKLSAEGRR